MTTEVQDSMCSAVQGPGPGGGGALSMDGLDWDSSLFDELSNFVDIDDFEDGKCSAYETSFDDLHFTMDLMSWNSYPWNVPDRQCTGDLKPEPLSPASSCCSVQSPLSADSPFSSSQYVPEEVDISSSSQMSPVSLYSEATRSPRSLNEPEEKPTITIPLSTGSSSTKQRKLAPVVPKPSIQPKIILVPTSADIQSASGIAPKHVLLQPLTTLLPKPQQLITIQPTAQAGQRLVLTPSAVVQLPVPGIVASQPVLSVNGAPRLLSAPSINQLSHTSINGETSPVNPLLQTSIQTTDCGADINVIRRQQRMIKNRESAFQSRRKKKEYMQGLEMRLRAALSENEKLKKENGSLQKLLEEVVYENQKLKVTAPKRRAVCLMMLAAFLLINFSSLSILESNPGPFDVEVSPLHTRRRNLLEFSPGKMYIKDKAISSQDISHELRISTEKALMVVKEDPLIYIPPPPCRPHVNQTESFRLNQELRGWVHRREVERTKSRRTADNHKARMGQKSDGKDGTQLVTMQYTETSLKNSVNELQIYYSSPRSYQAFLEAIRRRGDTFYIVSFRKDHLLLPATNRNKTSRPKMSIILPSTNVNDNVINEQEYEVMMQIDCEVMDTRILHVKSATIPPFLREHRENRTNSFYNSASSGSEHAHVVSTISESPR